MKMLASNLNTKYSSRKVRREIEVVWRVHLLNPQCYINDCVHHFGKVIPHQCDDPHIEYHGHDQQQFKSKILHNPYADLVMTDAIKRQCKFIHKMIKINLWTPIYLEHIEGAITRYEQFMNAMWAPDKPQGLIMVPTNDIDLIWHSHQLDPTEYQLFCITHSPTGQLVTHNDNISKKVLTDNGQDTRWFWDLKYGALSYREGQQFIEHRGDPQYDNMQIYVPCPIWKIGSFISFLLIVGIILWLALAPRVLDVWWEIPIALNLIITSVITMCCFIADKTGGILCTE